MNRIFFFVFILSNVGCVSLDPLYQTPVAPIPSSLPKFTEKLEQGRGNYDWEGIVNDLRLQEVIKLALGSNRDIQKAITDIESARALYAEDRASLYPTANILLSSTRNRTITNKIDTSADIDSSISSFELDLFGRNQSLARAARENWLASQFTAQNTRLTLIAEISTAWLTLAADNSSLSLAKDMMHSAENSLKIVQYQQRAGTAAATDISEAMSAYQQARSNVISYQTQIIQDTNALNLLAGTTLPASILPGTLESLNEPIIKLVSVQVNSSVLLRRPDIQEAEHNLKSANANIGAARASFFPRISLTTSLGFGSDQLSSLFSHGIATWSFSPSVTIPLFTGGSNLAQLHYAEAQKLGLIATYEQTVQSAFKDVSDALARRATIAEQLDALGKYVAEEQKTLDIGMLRYREGVGDYLTVLTAQRTLWSAQQAFISLKLTDNKNRITLWQSLGGDIK